MPSDIDSNQLKRAVYERTDPKLPVIFEEMAVPEGTGRILVMQIFAGSPPYTDSSGAGKIRVGTDCQPLTGTVRRHLTSGTTDADFTAGEIPGDPAAHISASAMERLREAALRERAPDELLGLSDLDMLAALGVVRNGRLSRAGLLLAGKASSLEEHIQRYVWTHLRMQSDTQYSDRIDGHDAIPTALYRILDRIIADNPIATVEHGLFHHEYRTYPEIALREALMNASCHADFRIASPILVKQYSGRLEINNPGGLIGGISPEAILHHRPVARNPLVVEALTRLRLINRSNLGISRMFSAMLVEGKEVPLIQSQYDFVRVTFLAGDFSESFRSFVIDEEMAGRRLTVDHLLLLHYLIRHREVTLDDAARICQRQPTEMKEILSELERDRDYLEHGGHGRTAYWALRASLHAMLSAPGHPDRNRQLDMEAAKTRILSILKQRAEKGEPGLTNRDVRQITHLDRRRVTRLIRELEPEGVMMSGRGGSACYTFGSPR